MRNGINNLRVGATILVLLFAMSSKSQNSMDFDGVDDYVSVANASGLISGASGISLSLWVYPTNSSSGWPDFDGFAGFRNESDADFYILQLGGTDVEARFRNSGGTDYTITYTGGLNMNAWNHFVLTYDGSTLELYHNGSLASSIAASGSISNTTTPLDMGYVYYNGAASSFYLDGKLDDVALWDRALSSSEVNAIYNACGINLNDSGLQLCYEFNQGMAGGNNTSITSLTDSKGSNNGTFNNIALSGTSSNFSSGLAGSTAATITETACKSYTVPSGNMTYTTSGNYMDTIPNGNGCDSIITINLTIDSADVSVAQSGDTLTAAAAGATYQWIDCGNQMAIAGAVNNQFVPTVSGSYAVVVTENGCVDTSACFNVTLGSIGLDEHYHMGVSAYPNPTKNDISLCFTNPGPFKVDISNPRGQVVLSKDFSSSGKHSLRLAGPEGVYFIRISSRDNVEVLKVLKK